MRAIYNGTDEVCKAMNQPCDECGLFPGTEAGETFGYAYPLCVACKTERLLDAARETVTV